ncbi:hypothetical protein VTJ83DRAFT_4144 [Remersonia thermophila]|uniref:Uncharacterized protein n=1 Tax=Remersonia thermophila TaxID=72144 RepID=A0ABR4DBA0_9PEZI
MRRNEASLVASILRDAQNPQEAAQAAARNDIPESLYEKAQDRQDELTEAERQLLLSRGDAIGKALAYPDSLTADEIHQVCAWPPPDVVRANIQQATDGKLSTPAELYAKIKAALENGQFETAITDVEACLIVHDFYSEEEFCPTKCMDNRAVPKRAYASKLVSRRLGIDLAVWKACAKRSLEVENARLAAQLDHQLPELTMNWFSPLSAPHPLPSDMGHRVPCPGGFDSVGAFQLFAQDYYGSPALVSQSAAAWAALSEDEKGAYRARAEAARRQEWADYEIQLTRKDAGLPQLPPSGPLPLLLQALLVQRPDLEWLLYNRVLPCTGFEVFRNDVVAEDPRLGFWDVLARWDALTHQQRAIYEIRSLEINKEMSQGPPPRLAQ